MAFNGPGSLRWKVVLQTEGTTGNTTTWANSSVWMSIETAAAGDEGESAGHSSVGQVQYVLTLRNAVSINARDRVVWGAKTLQIQSVRMLNLAYTEARAIELQ
jgi:hypothetical protein